MRIEHLKCFTPNVDIVIHIDELLDLQARQHIEDEVELEDGVAQARFNTERHHLMIVGYDPKQTSSGSILDRIKLHKLRAQIIGGV